MPRTERQRLMARPAWPAPTMATSIAYMDISSTLRFGPTQMFDLGQATSAQLLGDGNRYRDAVAQDVENGRAGARLLDDLLQFLARRIAFDLEADRDVAIAVADFIRDAEDAPKVDIALDEGPDLGELHPSGGGDISDPGGQTGRQCVQQPFDRRRRAICAAQYRRMIAIGGIGLDMFVRAARAMEVGHGGAAVGAVEPFVAGTELKFGQVGLAGDEVDRVDEGRRIDAVERRSGRSGLDVHNGLLSG